jgi:hypothetical protein
VASLKLVFRRYFSPISFPLGKENLSLGDGALSVRVCPQLQCAIDAIGWAKSASVMLWVLGQSLLHAGSVVCVGGVQKAGTEQRVREVRAAVHRF